VTAKPWLQIDVQLAMARRELYDSSSYGFYGSYNHMRKCLTSNMQKASIGEEQTHLARVLVSMGMDTVTHE
jgi:hypothetical protein